MVNTERSAGNRASAPQPQPPLDGDAVKQGAGAAAQNLKDQVQETAGQATEQVKQTAQSLLSTQKERVTRNLDALSDSLRQASTQLRGSEGGAFFATALDGAAARVQRVSGHLDEREVSELFADLERYARRQPAVFLGGMFAAGTLAARFLRSTGGGTTGGGLNVRPPAQTVSGHPATTVTFATATGQSLTRRTHDTASRDTALACRHGGATGGAATRYSSRTDAPRTGGWEQWRHAGGCVGAAWPAPATPVGPPPRAARCPPIAPRSTTRSPVTTAVMAAFPQMGREPDCTGKRRLRDGRNGN